jgi:hypothetical protein
MPAPVPGVRGTPNGKKLGDGYITQIAFAAAPTAAYFEVAVTPPGIEGGDPIDTTTQLNVAWRTKHHRRLHDMTPAKLSCLYDPIFYSTALAIINVPTTITVLFPDHSSLAFFGYLKSFQPGPLEDGKVPNAELEVIPTNQDPVSCAEFGPVYTAGGGTGC